jgi:hypothetical protein
MNEKCQGTHHPARASIPTSRHPSHVAATDLPEGRFLLQPSTSEQRREAPFLGSSRRTPGTATMASGSPAKAVRDDPSQVAWELISGVASLPPGDSRDPVRPPRVRRGSRRPECRIHFFTILMMMMMKPNSCAGRNGPDICPSLS